MTKTKVLLVVAFAAAFAAGVAVGFAVWGDRHRSHGPSWLAAELDLTDTQKEQMHEIWSEVMSEAFRDHWQRRRAMAEQRDQAILDLLTDAQRTQYDAILQTYAERREAMEEERKAAFQQAVERTKAILTPEQAAKYEELIKRGPKHGPGDRRGPRDRRGRGERRGPPPTWDDRQPPPEPPDDNANPPSPPRGEE